MSEEQLEQTAASKIGEHRLLILVASSIVIALILVGISMAMYANSPAAQLDLSRPGYKSVQTKTEQFNDFKDFPASGPVSKDTLDDFKKLYDKQAREASGFDAYGGDALGEQTLHIDSGELAEPTDSQ